ncbi:anti-anti-sigma factor [Saccharopolyspora kobensis]|uniref:Anti-anti-sigma factor n=1 Tax=Saccharopolyspora kobensis TaxID=146035 RepID=A0A1H5VK16_9PSEU|nr:STAS domain-containing protein [Saccharopolyspora kobensis]SEF87550.1 anti-anti-sigma factor [Saccharopolyspora kobensis]SFC60048.1 anti-anti-sigma factor [Saccharopolyspora kobensis]
MVIRVGGELDRRTAARLHELLATRLSSMADTVVLELSGLSFIGVAGLELLLHAHRQAGSRGVDLRLVTGDVHCLRRALIAAESTETFHCYTTLERALATVSGRLRELQTG